MLMKERRSGRQCIRVKLTISVLQVARNPSKKNLNSTLMQKAQKKIILSIITARTAKSQPTAVAAADAGTTTKLIFVFFFVYPAFILKIQLTELMYSMPGT